MSKSIFLAIQIILGFILIFLISIQTKGTGLGRAFGQSANISFKRRGLERLVFRITFVVSLLFILFSGIQLFL